MLTWQKKIAIGNSKHSQDIPLTLFPLDVIYENSEEVRLPCQPDAGGLVRTSDGGCFIPGEGQIEIWIWIGFRWLYTDLFFFSPDQFCKFRVLTLKV